MAHPFTTVNLGFSVMGETTLWWGGCAWDSFRMPNLVKDEPSVLVATTCPRLPGSRWHGRSGAADLQKVPEVAHFLVPMDKAWNNVVYTCSNQRLFCSEHCVQAWLAGAAKPQGYVMDLAVAVAPGVRWPADASTAPTSARTRRVPPTTPVPLACTGPSGGSTTDVEASSIPAPPGLRHRRPSSTTSPSGSPFRHRVLRRLASRDAKPAGQRDGIAHSP